jgi:hypothetical protein
LESDLGTFVFSEHLSLVNNKTEVQTLNYGYIPATQYKSFASVINQVISDFHSISTTEYNTNINPEPIEYFVFRNSNNYNVDYRSFDLETDTLTSLGSVSAGNIIYSMNVDDTNVFAGTSGSLIQQIQYNGTNLVNQGSGDLLGGNVISSILVDMNTDNRVMTTNHLDYGRGIAYYAYEDSSPYTWTLKDANGAVGYGGGLAAFRSSSVGPKEGYGDKYLMINKTMRTFTVDGENITFHDSVYMDRAFYYAEGTVINRNNGNMLRTDGTTLYLYYMDADANTIIDLGTDATTLTGQLPQTSAYCNDILCVLDLNLPGIRTYSHSAGTTTFTPLQTFELENVNLSYRHFYTSPYTERLYMLSRIGSAYSACYDVASDGTVTELSRNLTGAYNGYVNFVPEGGLAVVS